MENELRLSKLMAQRGICSRRKADEFISKGLVFVNGQKVETLGSKVAPDCRVELASTAKKTLTGAVSLILNKPVGYVSSQPEDGHQPASVLIRAENQQGGGVRLRPAHLRGLAVVGRLDFESQGLLIFTQNGVLARKIIGPESQVPKEYLVRVRGPSEPGLIKKLRHGLVLDGEPLKPAEVEWINYDQLRVVLRQGKKRQIRRMCELVGFEVCGLKRVRIGSILLGPLREGCWRFLGPDEVALEA